MRAKKQAERIIEENYSAVYRFCRSRLWDDENGAEECTQEVFLLFIQKINELNLNDKIERWLIAAASRIIKNYLKNKAKRAEYETNGVEELVSPDVPPEERSPAFQKLTNEEYHLLQRYYDTDRNSREELASELGISMNTLYQRIYAIKNKIDYTK